MCYGSLLMRLRSGIAVACVASLAASACSTESPAHKGPVASEDEVRIDTESVLARAQYDANVDFVNRYRPTCTRARRPGVKRVLVSGFGRFLSIRDNATGRIVSALSGVPYPESPAPESGQIDPPEPQLAVGLAEADWPLSGPVEICAMILPVAWDVAPILLLRELAAFQPDLVLMNGVAGSRQDLWIELGGVNDASPQQDGSGIQTPYDQRDENGDVPILESAPRTHPNLMSWRWVQEAARRARDDAAAADEEFGAVLPGVALAGFPRNSNTYLCNNITFVTSYLMDSPDAGAELLVASSPVEDRPNSVRVSLPADFHTIPRTFLHWPSELVFGDRPARAAEILAALADAQLAAGAKHPTTLGDNSLAAPELGGGETF